LMEEKFKSTVVLFPSTTSSISKSLMAENPLSSKHDIMQFGEEEDAEQMLQILNSDEIRDRIIQKYELMKHYKIDTTSKFKNTKLVKEFEDNISFKLTEFMSIKIDVLDTDPVMAANIANDIAALVDTVKNRMQKERAMQGFKIIEQELRSITAEIREKEDSLNVLRSLGVIDYLSQSEMYGEQYAIAVAKNDKSAMRALEERLDILAKYGGASIGLLDDLELDRKQLRLIKTKFDEAKVDAEQNITHTFIVNRAVPAEKKTYPVRWLIVVVSTFSAMFSAVILIVLLESINNTRKQLHVEIIKDKAPVIEASVN
jgi:capsular polysaccharide biosynthesis protein